MCPEVACFPDPATSRVMACSHAVVGLVQIVTQEEDFSNMLIVVKREIVGD